MLCMSSAVRRTSAKEASHDFTIFFWNFLKIIYRLLLLRMLPSTNFMTLTFASKNLFKKINSVAKLITMLTRLSQDKTLQHHFIL
ncbi:CLUMA_CG017355, isoform A [Clunio marinus]|uniref:CLUMA_CG017355, isoform A n=1 Tax=Clunio marinus TaxID=568069 RepID=A0A1J1IVQ1_9DIPT|nr:CLUMA_CG017355, isoform A [Clunio marinus]